MTEAQASHKRKWPKILPELTLEQRAISDDFMKYWHETLSSRYKIVDQFNHEYAVRTAPEGFVRTLEIGAGNGEHLGYERLTDRQEAQYVALDIRQNMLDELHKRFPRISALRADCQKRMDFQDGHFDRIVAIHVLEHLPDLPAAVREMHRLCDKAHGVLTIVIPCEGGFAYEMARRVSAQRLFERRYQQSYRWFIAREHLNRPFEIFEELSACFERVSCSYFPLGIRSTFWNLCIGACFKPRSNV